MTELPNLPINQQPELLNDYMPWSKNIQANCANSQLSEKISDSWPFVVRTEKVRYFYISGLQSRKEIIRKYSYTPASLD